MLDSFFGMHPYVLRSGLWRKMKPGEKDLYVYLLEESERRCTREIGATDAQMTALIGTASRTLCNARKKLVEYGLVTCKAGQGNRYTYAICDPKTGLPYPGDPRTPIIVPRRERSKEADLPHGSTSSAPRKEPLPSSSKSLPDERMTLERYGLPGVF